MEDNNKKTAIIIGAGPAGLTAARELVEKTDIKPIIIERDNVVGGLSKTLNYKGNLIDIGPHRWFSKSDKIMKIWEDLFPFTEPSENAGEEVMLYRDRKTRIYFLKKLFDYPVSLNWTTIKNLGFFRIMKIGFSYVRAVLFPIKNEKNLEEFFVNRFGRELYETFFEFYTEKLWGKKCREISAEWGAQRVKGVSISNAIKDVFKKIFTKKDLKQKNIETSLIDRFIYPKYGSGQFWGKTAEIVKNKGGEIFFNKIVNKIKFNKEKGIVEVGAKNENGEGFSYEGNYLFSTMPVKDFLESLEEDVPEEVKEIGRNLEYRDMVVVSALLKKIKLKEKEEDEIIKDNWIYIQERDMLAGRMQIANNMSPYLVRDRDKVWVGLEYFCDEGDDFWSKSDTDIRNFVEKELVKSGIIDEKDMLDCFIKRVPKAYPAYFGSYEKFDKIKEYLNGFDNLFLIGRNGMHRYNNMDHSMLTAITAVDNIINNRRGKDNIWAVNTEKEYHEVKK